MCRPVRLRIVGVYEFYPPTVAAAAKIRAALHGGQEVIVESSGAAVSQRRVDTEKGGEWG